MIFTITAKERDMIVLALNILQEDYSNLSRAVVSAYLTNGFESDKCAAGTLSRRALDLRETLSTEVMDKQALSLWQAGHRIDAIKLIRTNTMLGLKDAKEYAEKLANQPLIDYVCENHS